jgi:Coenzyme PQQ synthesis protein D (PqqD)
MGLDGQAGSGERAFTVDASRVVHETIDGETILIALDTGSYYSLTGSGPEIWSLLAVGHPVEAAAQALAERYPQQSQEAASELRRLAVELEREGLLVPGPAAAATVAVGEGQPGAFTAAALERYTDMEYFLRLDPIHEVDPARGWPVRADGDSTG